MNENKKYLTAGLILSQILFPSIAVSQNGALGLGLRPNTEAEELEVKQNWKKIKKVKLNKRGLERVNNERIKKGLPVISETEAVADGEESEFVAGAVNDGVTTENLGATAVPTFVDNSKLSSFPLIKSQGSMNSCVSWAIMYYQMSHHVGLQKGWNNKNEIMSTKFSPKWTYNMVNGGVDNGSGSTATYKVVQYNGALTLDTLPYDTDFKSWHNNSENWKSALSYRIDAPQYITALSTTAGIENAKAILANGYVLTFGTYINSWQYKTILNNPNSTNDDSEVGKNIAYWLNGSVGGHMMTIVGYNDDIWVDVNSNSVLDAGELGAFRIANSWGTGWQDQGFVWIAYDSFKTTSAVVGAPVTGRVGMAQSDRAIHVIPKLNYQPKLIAEVDLSHSLRNQIAVTIGSSEMSASSPSTSIAVGVLQSQGGAMAFDGSASTTLQRFVLDLTDLVPVDGRDQKYYVNLTDTDTITALNITDFVLQDMTHQTRSPSSTATPSTVVGVSKSFSLAWNYSSGSTPVADLIGPVTSLSMTSTSSSKNFTANVSDSSGISKVEFYLDGVLKYTDSTAAYTYSLSLRKVSSGTHSVHVISYDMLGNKTVSSAIQFVK